MMDDENSSTVKRQASNEIIHWLVGEVNLVRVRYYYILKSIFCTCWLWTLSVLCVDGHAWRSLYPVWYVSTFILLIIIFKIHAKMIEFVIITSRYTYLFFSLSNKQTRDWEMCIVFDGKTNWLFFFFFVSCKENTTRA